MDSSEAAKNALEFVLEAKKNERLVIFCDDVRADVGEAFRRGTESLGLRTTYVLFKTSQTIFRTEIPPEHMPLLTTERPDIYVNLLTGTREETPFRIKLIHAEAGKHQTRLAHCPGITMDMLTEGALALTIAQHRQMQASADRLMKKLDGVVRIELTTPAGTDLTFSVENREFFTDTKIDWKTLKWMNLPTGEVIVAPVENSLEGTLVCDVAVGGIGPLKEPVTLAVKDGRVRETRSADATVKKRVDTSLATDTMASVVGEFAFGINPKARLIEEFLETEKIKGTVHIAFGDNTDFPSGQNNSANHMDFLMSKPTVKAYRKDGTPLDVLKDGVYRNKLQ
jgi:leucyl aminopeptidase (aminopeptidase T)